MTKLYLLLVALAFVRPSTEAQAPVPAFPVADGIVRSIARDGNTIYIGGEFSFIGPDAPYGSLVSPATGAPDLAFARPNGIVYTVTPDDAGGWYIGGAFTQVGAQPRAGLARINADGSLNAFNPGVTGGAVRSLALSGTTLYVGGAFTQAGGQSRSKIAAIDAGTGIVTAWNPGASNSSSGNAAVRSLLLQGQTLYVGGEFNTLAGQTRNHLAAFDLPTGNLTAWNPNVDGQPGNGGLVSVNSITSIGTTIYYGGVFARSGTLDRPFVAAADSASGSTLPWRVNIGGNLGANVQSVLAYNGTVYIGGTYTFLDAGQGRNGLGAVDAVTAAISPWNPGPYPGNANATFGDTYGVYAMVIDGGTLYIGGRFTQLANSFSGPARNHLAAVDLSTGVATPWICNTSGLVQALSFSGGKLYAGGNFISAGGQLRNYIAAVDATTMNITGWYPGVNNYVRAIAVSNGTVYLGGYFDYPHRYIAAFNGTTGNLMSFNPDSYIAGFAGTSNVHALTVNGNRLYAGGTFAYQVNGQSRSNVAAFDATSGAQAPWDPGVVNGMVNDIRTNGNTVYIAGDFTTAAGQTRNHLAALTNDAVALATSWNPNITGSTVNALTLDGTRLFAGGAFTTVGSTARGNLASIDLATGSAGTWSADADGAVYSLALNSGYLNVGGSFANIGGQARANLASVSTATGTMAAWNPGMAGTVFTLWNDGARLYAGGNFSAVGNDPRFRLAAFDAPSAAPLPVRLLTFNAQAKQVNGAWTVDCRWRTASEQNSRSFTVERSGDARIYTAIGSRPAAGNSSTITDYIFSDISPLQGISYYRLRMTDVDGRESRSAIALVLINTQGSLLVYPNPIHDAANIIIATTQKQEALYTLTDAGGKIVLKGSWSLQPGSNPLTLPLPHLPAGTYTLQVRAPALSLQTTLLKH